MTPERNRRLPALLFDMDGTLLDSIGLIVESAVYAFDGREGPRPTRDEWQALIGTPLDAMLARWATDAADAAFLKGRYRHFQITNHDGFVRLYDGVDETLRALHAAGHPLAIVSSKLDEGIRRSMDYFRLTPLFDAIVGIDHTTRHKPHPEPVEFALARLGVRELDDSVVAATLGTVLKYREDHDKVTEQGISQLIKQAFDKGLLSG